VALQQVGAGGHDGVWSGESWRVAHPRGQTIFGVALDPHRGLDARPCPWTMLGHHLGRTERREESWRLFYVGFTRAKRSVTLAIGREDVKGANPTAQLRATFVAREGVRVIGPEDLDVDAPLAAVRAPTARLRPFEAVFHDAPSEWCLATPSGRSADADLLARYARSAQVVAGTASPALPAAYADVPERVLGDVVHGWLERWAFAGEPTAAAARAYLGARGSADEPVLAAWLVELGLGLRDRLPGFSALLRHRLHFEWPIVGIDGDDLLVGRMDLVVELPHRELIVLDFKAGSRVATAGEIPGLRDYAGQLEAYRVLLEKAGYRVIETGLVYVRGPVWVRFAG
jgi:ATP-dependent exoDNAse (exonuclease V) beta subunit